ncbi:hypothetical protein EVAR_74299_1 [Eumeta japonica]|uniref:Uncharacterized protein n=1 Tax=Eumeta variegata TaxID=151549 RepID=A0A4C1SFI5_EUMVA|nr:hypothetical protein EVAR_74299_1 [Eumeta japonica]
MWKNASHQNNVDGISHSQPDEIQRQELPNNRNRSGGSWLKQRKSQGLQKIIVDFLKKEATFIIKGPQEDLEIRDLDDTTMKEHILAALQKTAGEEYHISLDAIRSLRSAYKAQCALCAEYQGIETLPTMQAQIDVPLLKKHSRRCRTDENKDITA